MNFNNLIDNGNDVVPFLLKRIKSSKLIKLKYHHYTNIINLEYISHQKIVSVDYSGNIKIQSTLLNGGDCSKFKIPKSRGIRLGITSMCNLISNGSGPILAIGDKFGFDVFNVNSQCIESSFEASGHSNIKSLKTMHDDTNRIMSCSSSSICCWDIRSNSNPFCKLMPSNSNHDANVPSFNDACNLPSSNYVIGISDVGVDLFDTRKTNEPTTPIVFDFSHSSSDYHSSFNHIKGKPFLRTFYENLDEFKEETSAGFSAGGRRTTRPAVYNEVTKHFEQKFRPHSRLGTSKNNIINVTSHTDGRHIITSSYTDKCHKVWNIHYQTGVCSLVGGQFVFPSNSNNNATFSSPIGVKQLCQPQIHPLDNKLLVSADETASIYVWNIYSAPNTSSRSNAKVIVENRSKRFANHVTSLSISADGTEVATGDIYGTILIRTANKQGSS